MRRLLLGAALLTAGLLAGCDDDNIRNPEPVDEARIRLDDDIFYTQLDLPDGRRLECVRDLGLKRGGISCNWAAPVNRTNTSTSTTTTLYG